MTEQKTALVLGATGGIGGALARRLVAAGWRVKALHRNAAAQREQAGATWVQGDAMRREDVVAAASGVALIVHAVNPPGYRNWETLVLPMLDNTIAAARASGARIVLPGTVYNFGPDAFPVLTEDSPQHPVTKKGAIRVEMEHRLREASQDGVRTLIVRAGDFFGPGSGNTWFAQVLVKPGKPVRRITYPGRRGVGHQWTYLPDMAETILRLIERERELPAFVVFHMRGHFDADGTAMITAIRKAVGRPDLPVGSFPWWLLPLAAPFVTLFRELKEMRYLWREPLRMDNSRLVAFLGAEPHTTLDEAVRATLAALGCLDAATAQASPARSVV